MVTTRWHAWTNSQGRSTGVLEIITSERRIWSIPSLWGCPVRCSFCISSSQPYGGPLREDDLVALVSHVRQMSTGGLPVELSFTGEGEAVLNVDAVRALMRHAASWPEIAFARICVSGLHMTRSVEFTDLPWPTRLQCSLHSAIQKTRDVLVPNSVHLGVLHQELVVLTPMFASVDVNVVLQPGVNDSDAHLSALLLFVKDTPWRVVFNPLMQEGATVVHPAREAWVNALRQQGTDAQVYSNIGARIVEQGIYQQLTFVPSVHRAIACLPEPLALQ